MAEYVTKEDLALINKALCDGYDIRIQRTKDGYRIIRDAITVLKKESRDKK